jgi:hypothetical protein
MIADTQQLFIDILRLMPFEADLLIQSPHEEVLSVLEDIEHTKGEVFNTVRLSRENRQKLIYEVIYNDIEEYMQSIQIKIGDQLLFEGYDGLEYGTFSREFQLPSEFLEEYTPKKMVSISNEW